MRQIQTILYLMVLFAVVTFATVDTRVIRIDSDRPVHTVVETVTITHTVKPFTKKSVITAQRGGLFAFMRKLSEVESDNTPTAVNRFGMLGKYQFSPRTLRLMGITVNKEEFLSNEALQDSALVMYLKENHRTLRPIIAKYDGTMYRGVYITKSGILASAHLMGHGGVWSFFDPSKYSYATADANGTSIEMYMRKFANYKLEF